MSAGLEPSKQIFIHGFVNIEGRKISKSAGNTIDPFYLADKYGTDAVRYYFARHIHPFEDSDFDEDKFKEAYQADLANGLGNFASRVLTLGESLGKMDKRKVSEEISGVIENAKEEFGKELSSFRIHEATAKVWRLISYGDGYVNENKPWETNDPQAIFNLVVILDNVASLIQPIMPGTSEKITKAIKWDGDTLTINKIDSLFPRLT